MDLNITTSGKYLKFIRIERYYVLTDPSNSTFLSVYSRGPAHDVQIDKLGVYMKTHETKNGKPTWRNNQTGHSIFFHGENIKHQNEIKIYSL